MLKNLPSLLLIRIVNHSSIIRNDRYFFWLDFPERVESTGFSVTANAMRCTMNMPITKEMVANFKQGQEELTTGIEVGGIYEHVGGRKYRVMGIARNSDDLQLCVIYQCHDCTGSCPLLIKSIQDFGEMISIDGNAVPRFRPVTAQASIA